MDRIISLLRNIEDAAGKVVKINDDILSKETTYSSKKIVSLLTNAGFAIKIVSVLPLEGDNNTIYFVPISSGGTLSNNVYNEYMWIDNNWENIGSTSIDLTDYYTKTTIDSLLLGKLNSLTTDANIYLTGSTLLLSKNLSGLDSIVTNSVGTTKLDLLISGKSLTLSSASGINLFGEGNICIGSLNIDLVSISGSRCKIYPNQGEGIKVDFLPDMFRVSTNTYTLLDITGSGNSVTLGGNNTALNLLKGSTISVGTNEGYSSATNKVYISHSSGQIYLNGSVYLNGTKLENTTGTQNTILKETSGHLRLGGSTTKTMWLGAYSDFAAENVNLGGSGVSETYIGGSSIYIGLNGENKYIHLGNSKSSIRFISGTTLEAPYLNIGSIYLTGSDISVYALNMTLGNYFETTLNLCSGKILITSDRVTLATGSIELLLGDIGYIQSNTASISGNIMYSGSLLQISSLNVPSPKNDFILLCVDTASNLVCKITLDELKSFLNI